MKLKRFLALWFILLSLSWPLTSLQAGRLFNDASTQYLEVGSALLTAAPITFAAWVYPDDASVQTQILTISATATADNFFALNFTSTAQGQKVAASALGAGFGESVSTATYSANVWSHAAAVFASTTSRTAYLNGVAGTTETSSRTPNASLINRTNIGVVYLTTNILTNPMSGRLAEVGLWNVALTTKEVAALAAGASPRQIQPTNLVGYWPIWGVHSPEINLGTNHTGMTITGATATRHAPVLPFTKR